MALRRTTQPTAEPVLLAEAKLHLRVDHDDEDELIDELITAARETCEKRLRRTLLTSGWTLTLDSFAELHCFANPPVVGVGSISYLDSASVSQTLDPAAYDVDFSSEPARIRPASSWPSTAARMAAVTVVYTAGYQSAADIPRPIKQWILLAIGEMYENREELPENFNDRLLDPYKIWG